MTQRRNGRKVPSQRLPPAWASFLLVISAALLCTGSAVAAAAASTGNLTFPPPLESYADSSLEDLRAVLSNRVQRHPFNLIASLLFLGAVVHTFFTYQFRHWAHLLEERHRRRSPDVEVSVSSRLLHFLGEVEAVFGLWVVPLILLMSTSVGWTATGNYINHRVNYNEPLFVVVIMAIASTRPILEATEAGLRRVARLGGGTPLAWWWSILTLGPLLGSFITEPAAMTISASLLARQFYAFRPAPRFAYATLGLLFVNVSVGGTLTHFAAPPVLMVAGTWGWSSGFMAKSFGLPALVGIIAANAVYFGLFRKDLAALAVAAREAGSTGPSPGVARVPLWITVAHILFMGWSVLSAHTPAFLIGGFLFFLAFHHATENWQSPLELRSPILVGFFLAGLVIHGGLQQWWIAPVLSRLGEVPLMLGSLGLTAFNDNAAITYLATLVPGLTDAMKYAVVAGAVAGGGLTVIANAPNPAGQAILGKFFPDGISPLRLFLGALIPTVILTVCFLIWR